MFNEHPFEKLNNQSQYEWNFSYEWRSRATQGHLSHFIEGNCLESKYQNCLS